MFALTVGVAVTILSLVGAAPTGRGNSSPAENGSKSLLKMIESMGHGTNVKQHSVNSQSSSLRNNAALKLSILNQLVKSFPSQERANITKSIRNALSDINFKKQSFKDRQSKKVISELEQKVKNIIRNNIQKKKNKIFLKISGMTPPKSFFEYSRDAVSRERIGELSKDAVKREKLQEDEEDEEEEEEDDERKDEENEDLPEKQEEKEGHVIEEVPITELASEVPETPFPPQTRFDPLIEDNNVQNVLLDPFLAGAFLGNPKIETQQLQGLANTGKPNIVQTNTVELPEHGDNGVDQTSQELKELEAYLKFLQGTQKQFQSVENQQDPFKFLEQLAPQPSRVQFLIDPETQGENNGDNDSNEDENEYFNSGETEIEKKNNNKIKYVEEPRPKPASKEISKGGAKISSKEKNDYLNEYVENRLIKVESIENNADDVYLKESIPKLTSKDNYDDDDNDDTAYVDRDENSHEKDDKIEKYKEGKQKPNYKINHKIDEDDDKSGQRTEYDHIKNNEKDNESSEDYYEKTDKDDSKSSENKNVDDKKGKKDSESSESKEGYYGKRDEGESISNESGEGIREESSESGESIREKSSESRESIPEKSSKSRESNREKSSESKEDSRENSDASSESKEDSRENSDASSESKEDSRENSDASSESKEDSREKSAASSESSESKEDSHDKSDENSDNSKSKEDDSEESSERSGSSDESIESLENDSSKSQEDKNDILDKLKEIRQKILNAIRQNSGSDSSEENDSRSSESSEDTGSSSDSDSHEDKSNESSESNERTESNIQEHSKESSESSEDNSSEEKHQDTRPSQDLEPQENLDQMYIKDEDPRVAPPRHIDQPQNEAVFINEEPRNLLDKEVIQEVPRVVSERPKNFDDIFGDEELVHAIKEIEEELPLRDIAKEIKRDRLKKYSQGYKYRRMPRKYTGYGYRRRPAYSGYGKRKLILKPIHYYPIFHESLHEFNEQTRDYIENGHRVRVRMPRIVRHVFLDDFDSVRYIPGDFSDLLDDDLVVKRHYIYPSIKLHRKRRRY